LACPILLTRVKPETWTATLTLPILNLLPEEGSVMDTAGLAIGGGLDVVVDGLVVVVTGGVVVNVVVVLLVVAGVDLEQAAAMTPARIMSTTRNTESFFILFFTFPFA
jgi:hypothetical protein